MSPPGRIGASSGAHRSREHTPRATNPAVPANVRDLAETAARTRSDTTDWKPGSSLRGARNAHQTNTRAQLRDALESDANWLEGDVSRVDGRLVMAHPGDEDSAELDLRSWAHVAQASGRGVKLDLKASARDDLDGVLRAIEDAGIDSGRVMVNVGDAPASQLVKIRTALPDAWISLNPEAPSGGYSDAALDDVIDKARTVGGRVSFALRWDAAGERVVERLKPHGAVSIWANPWYGTPSDPVSEMRDLRARGIDGMVDLGDRQSKVQLAASVLRRSAGVVLRRDPYVIANDARSAVTDAINGARDLASAGSSAVDSAYDWMDERVGGLLPFGSGG